jgi:hypothetical protein
MKKLFVLGIVGLVLFEVANVFFIMPLPGSQRMRSVELAHWLYSWRWFLRVTFVLCVALGVLSAWRTPGWRRWLTPVALLFAAGVVYMTNFRMAADQMFRQPRVLVMQSAERNSVALDRLVVGVEINGDARAYPLQFIGYHHQVRDSAGGEPILVTYCTVCRTGRVFKPVIDGKVEMFRLVGMDHYNAMLEDHTTGTWWRQANGEAVVGERVGDMLEEVPSVQVTLERWLAMYPQSLIMQGDPAFSDSYAKDYAYERGTSRKKLTGTDTVSWNDKSWVVGLTLNEHSKAYDWNKLKHERMIHDEVGGVPILLVLGTDGTSFFAFQRPNANARFTMRNDSLVSDGTAYSLTGRGATGELKPLRASQEFWHSWRTFQPGTTRY